MRVPRRYHLPIEDWKLHKDTYFHQRQVQQHVKTGTAGLFTILLACTPREMKGYRRCYPELWTSAEDMSDCGVGNGRRTTLWWAAIWRRPHKDTSMSTNPKKCRIYHAVTTTGPIFADPTMTAINMEHAVHKVVSVKNYIRRYRLNDE
ncbi:hypothetical protein AcV7_008682 [Taiwanofungus camphoratus]|nr:hypothetical protein AcV7_008682 [Antrodia cinnamomea]